MSEDLGSGPVPPRQATDEEVIGWVRDAIEASHAEARRVNGSNGDEPSGAESASSAVEHNGVTVDLAQTKERPAQISRLPEEAIDIMKMEIER